MSAIRDEEESGASVEVIQQSPSASHYTLINNLNHDCLAKIFKYLSWEQRLEIEAVCKSWKEASKFAWDDMPVLKFSHDTPDMEKLPFHLRNTKGIGRILMRCGAYVRKLHVGKPCKNVILSIVARYCNNLRELEIKFEYHDINWNLILPYMERLESLKVLEIFRRNNFSTTSIQAFRNLKCLRHLKLSSFALNSEIIDAIGQKHNLIHLDLVYCEIGGSLTPLLYLENLKHLVLEEIPTVDDNFVIQLVGSCKHLTLLNLSFCNRISDVGIASLQRLSNLDELDVSHLDRITDGPLGAMYKLRKLDCCSCPNVLDGGIIKLIRNAPQLEYLDVIRTNVTEAVIVEALKVTRERSILPLELRVHPDLMENRTQEADIVRSPLLHIMRCLCFR